MALKGLISEQQKQQCSEIHKNSSRTKPGRQVTAKERAKASANVTLQHATRRVRPVSDEILREYLLKPEKNGRPFVHNYIETFLQEAKRDPNSPAARMLANYLFGGNLIDRIDGEIAKEQAKDQEFGLYRLRTTLFRQQMQVFDDQTSKQIIAVCSRRAGKTELAARLLLKAAYVPNLHCLYLHRTFENALNQVGTPINKLVKELELNPSGSLAGGMLKFPNGSYIKIAGCNNKGQVDTFRGDSNDFIILDEVGHMRACRELVREVLGPSLIQSKFNGAGGQMVFIGTPPRTKNSYARELWENSKIQHYFWTWQDNPFIPEDVTLESIAEQYGVGIDDPFIQREYLGQWVVDVNAEVFHGYLTFKELPAGAVTHAYIGVDWGYEDKAAVLGCVVINGRLYAVDEWQKQHTGIQEISNEIRAMYERIKTKYKPARDVQVITDTNDKQAQYDLTYVYKLPNVQNAYKHDKQQAIHDLADYCRTGKVFVSSNCTELCLDMDNCMYARDENTDEILSAIDEENWHMNIGYALLYVSRSWVNDVVLGNTRISEVTVWDDERGVTAYEDPAAKTSLAQLIQEDRGVTVVEEDRGL